MDVSFIWGAPQGAPQGVPQGAPDEWFVFARDGRTLKRGFPSKTTALAWIERKAKGQLHAEG